MIWFRKKEKRKPEEFSAPLVEFLIEQDGVPEREFKNRVITILENRLHVRSAFLAQVAYDNSPDIHIALCLRLTINQDLSLRHEIGEVFSSMFGSHEHLDVLMLKDAQESEIRKVCEAFYEAT